MTPGTESRLRFRPLQADDLPMLQAWLARPHVREWWGEPPSLAELAEDFLPKTHEQVHTRGYIALRDGDPIGFIQSYVVLGSGDGWWEDETDPGARGIDQFLAHADQLGQGLGSAMVGAFVAQLFEDPAVTKVQTDPSPDNERAIRSYRRAGFEPQGEVETPDGRALLMVCQRPAR
jgi:RimJ/RimL family protein N-acetyltransferase